MSNTTGNGLFKEQIDYTLVEEYMDEIMGDEPIPPSFTSVLKSVRRKFNPLRKYKAQSIRDAVETYYEKYGGAAKVRNMLITIANNTRDVSAATRKRMSDSHRKR